MSKQTLHRLGLILAFSAGIWISFRYLLPILLPFLLALLLALAAEPLTRVFSERMRIRRSLAAGLGVCIVLVLVTLSVMVLGAFAIRELSALAGILPDLGSAAIQGIGLLEQRLLNLAEQTPPGIRPMLTGGVENLFSGSSRLLEQLSTHLLGFASGVVMALPDSALGFGTWILASFMISAKLPGIRAFLRSRLPENWHSRYLPALKALKSSLGRWILAQLKLTGITAGILCAGFLLLRISYAPLWALLVSLVDALPVLGTGTVLLPWSLISFLQGDRIRAIGLLGVYLTVWLIRSILEPRFVGKQLGLDPLVTLIAMYAGYQLWGLGGMILSPMLAMTLMQLSRLPHSEP